MKKPNKSQDTIVEKILYLVGEADDDENEDRETSKVGGGFGLGR